MAVEVSEENLEIVQRVYDAVARHETETVLALYDPEVELDATRAAFRDVVRRRIYQGHEGLRKLDREWREAFDKIETECEELIDAGEQVIAAARYRGRGRASGVPVSGPVQYGVWTIREGKIVRVAWFDRRREALEAAGLSEPTSQENLEVVRKLAAAVSRRDLPQILELTDPQVEWRPFIAALTERRHYRGHHGIRQYLSDLDETFETFRTNIEDLLGVGDLVLGVGRIHFCGKGSGVETETPVGWLLKLRDRKVVRVHAFREPEKILETRLSE